MRRKQIVSALRKRYPNGHQQFIDRTVREMQLHNDKNHDYAGGGRPMGNFERVSQILALYPGLPLNRPECVALIYMLKQLDAVLWGWANDVKHKVEGAGTRLADVSVYAKLAEIMHEEGWR